MCCEVSCIPLKSGEALLDVLQHFQDLVEVDRGLGNCGLRKGRCDVHMLVTL